MNDPIQYDIAIIGYGPVGATFANLLGDYGFNVVVIEREAEIYDKPRAIVFDHEISRVFQSCGLMSAIEPLTSAHPGTDFLGVDGEIIKVFDPMPPPNPLGWQPTSMFIQPELEAELRAGVARYPHVDVLLSHELERFEQDDVGVSMAVRNLADRTVR